MSEPRESPTTLLAGTSRHVAPGFGGTQEAAGLRAKQWLAANGERLGSWAAFVVPFTLYLLTIAPTVYNLDSAELTTAAATGGIVRATGYPLYLILGRAWSLLPLGDVGFRLNLMSAFFGALTVWLADRILKRLEVGPWARLAALGLLSSAPFFWSLSLVAEVYTLHTALAAGTIVLLMRWRQRPTSVRLFLAVLLVSLSMGNHLATVLLVPGSVFFVVTAHPRQLLKPVNWLVAVGAILLGLSVYLYLPLRYAAEPAFNYAGTYDARGAFVPVDLSTVDGIWWLVSGKSFAGQMFAYARHEIWREAAHFGVQLWGAFFVLGIGPGLLGMVKVTKRDWRYGGLLMMIFLANAVFYVNYRVIDKDTMYLPNYLIWGLWAGVGFDELLKWLRQEGQGQLPLWLARAVIAGTLLLAVGSNWQRVDLSADRSARERGEEILLQARKDAIVLGWWDTVPVVQYLQLVEGQRPDVLAINRFLIAGERMEELIRHEVIRRPVYISSPPTSMLNTLTANRTGPLYRLLPKSSEQGGETLYYDARPTTEEQISQ